MTQKLKNLGYIRADTPHANIRASGDKSGITRGCYTASLRPQGKQRKRSNNGS